MFKQKFNIFYNNLIPFAKLILVLLTLGSFIIILYKWNYDKASLIIDFLKSTLWQITALIFIFIFKNNLAKLIDEISEGNIFGNQFKRSHSKKNQELESSPTTSQVEDYKSIADQYRTKIDELGSNNEELKKTLTSTQIFLDFERIYNAIFGSQIRLLEFLNRITHFTLKGQNDYYMVLQGQYPFFKTYNFGDYLDFLFKSGLITNDEQGNISLTPKGRGFLSYVDILKYPKSKNL